MLVNPYFQMKDGKCSGIWSDKLVELLAQHRPEIHYIALQDGFGTVDPTSDAKDAFLRQRPVSIKLSLYRALADPMFHSILNN